MSGYLGYDPCALGVLLGALDRAFDERLPSRSPATRTARQAADRAVTAHGRQLAVLGELAQVVGLVLRADPLGAYRPVRLDPDDLDLWALHRGGQWRAARDPSPSIAGWDRQGAVLNARLVAGWLTPERWRELLNGDEDAVDPVLRYLEHLADDPAARSAFLVALGPKGFGAMLATASARFTSTHLPGAADQPAAGRARDAVDALGALWAAGRAGGGQRTEEWDAAALGGPLVAASRLLGIGAVAGALTSGELVRWGTAQWRRLSSDWRPSELPRPELVGDQILGALVADGRAARGFLLELSTGEDRADLASLVANSFTSPMVSGALLLASTDPSTIRTAGDLGEVERSVHAVLAVVDHLLAERLAQAPVADGEGRLIGRPGSTLPASLGLYTGRQLVHLVDRCDGARDACTPLGPGQQSTAWSGWEERQVARLLERLVVDRRTADEVREAALAGWFSRVGGTDLLAPGADDAVRRETFAVGALDGILGDREWDRSRIDHQRFQAQVAGLDLGIDMASFGVGRIPGIAAGAWGPVSDAGELMGAGGLGELALSFLRPEPAGDVRARTEAGQSLITANLKTAVGTMAAAQAGTGPSDPRPPGTALDRDAAVTAAATRSGDNANAGAYRQLAVGVPSQDAPGPVKDRIDHLQAVVGDTMTEGRAWVA